MWVTKLFHVKSGSGMITEIGGAETEETSRLTHTSVYFNDLNSGGSYYHLSLTLL